MKKDPRRTKMDVDTISNALGPYHVRWHEHDCYELLYILRGSRKVFVGDEQFIAKSDDLVTFRPHQRHSESSATKHISYVVLRFEPEHLEGLPVEFPGPDILPTVQRLPQRERIMTLLGHMIDEQQHGNEGADILLGGYLAELCILVKRAVTDSRASNKPRASDSSRRIRLSIELMQDSTGGSPRLEDLARKAFMSVSHFSHEFKRATGEPPKRYLIKERIERAKELLAATDTPASDIASMLDYESPSFFYRQFKQKAGMTTSEYRKRSRRSAEK